MVEMITKKGLNDELNYVRVQVVKAALNVLQQMPIAQKQNRSAMLSSLFVHIDDEVTDVRVSYLSPRP